MSDFILPDIGEGIVECELVKWLVSEGDLIEEDQPVAEVMTDKALVEIPASYKGRVARLYYREGDIARVHEPLFRLVAEGDEAEEAEQSEKAEAGENTEQAGHTATPAQPAAARTGPTGKRVPASPAVRRMVREQDLDLADVPGSGKDGRVLKADIQQYLDHGTRPPAAATPEPATAAARPRRPAAGQQPRVEPIRGVQAAMARHMAAAAKIPHFIYSEDIDVTDLLALRARLKPEAEAAGSRLTLMPFIMKAMALAVREYPVLNSQLNDEVTEVHYLPQCNIGMAVDSKSGLVVPNVKAVESLTLLEIADEVARLTEAARSGRVSQEDLRGGTITISNIGALGGTYAAPIINAPEVAIVALGRTRKLPRFDANGQVTQRSIMTVSWAGDHRIIDGGTIARFCNRWKGYLEAPQSMLLHLG
jgi:2-oxoisovalerate dehydrogenase E2 component (dihydrolipoyl transacylase)